MVLPAEASFLSRRSSMKACQVVLFLVLAAALLGPAESAAHSPSAETYVIFYFGSTDCAYCNMPANIEKIMTIKNEFPKLYPNAGVKFVLVCLDKDIEQGLVFVRKYGLWDEISVGSFYQNELALSYLNTAKIPGLPHIMVFKDIYSKTEKFSVPLIKERRLMVDLIGGTQIEAWISGGYKMAD